MKATAWMSLTCVLLASSISTLAAPTQDGTARPGQPTQARVWIENRGATEAVPVALQPPGPDIPPLPVQMTGTPTMTITGIVQTRAVREQWEYQAITIPNGQDVTQLLNAAGTGGWETTGLAVPTQNGTNVVMKRPR